MNKRKLLFNLLFIISGAIIGFLYWYYIGCNSGTCPITSKWHNTAFFGAIFGYLLGSSIIDITNKKKEEKME